MPCWGKHSKIPDSGFRRKRHDLALYLPGLVTRGREREGKRKKERERKRDRQREREGTEGFNRDLYRRAENKFKR